MRIGIVDLDTSHPQNWIPIERELGHEVVGIWDGGAVHPPDYVQSFAREYSVPRVYDALEEMVEDVECAVIHGCNWDTHVAKARPFVEAGKAVLIDKPIAGTVRDLNQLNHWAAGGARIGGGSSLRFCYETQNWLTRPIEERGIPHTVLCGCGVDDFNYGIHAYSMLAGIMGGGAIRVRHLGQGIQRRVQIHWPDGRIGMVIVGAAAQWLPFYTNITTERTVAQYQADSSQLYRALLEATLPYLGGETDQPPRSMQELIEPERWALAARRSWLEGDREVLLTELSEEDEGYDGRAFAVEYRKARYPEGT
jgi:hypothetical protein